MEKYSSFSLTVRQLENLLKKSKSDDNQEDILKFEIENGRLKVSQNNWGHDSVNVLMNKPC